MTPPLAALGPSEPDHITRELQRFGRNPQGRNIFRLTWSANKLMWLDDELIPEYDLSPPRWVLEKWVPPEVFAGSEIAYNMREQRQGPYPREGYWCESFAFPPGVPLSAGVIADICTLIQRGRALTMHERVAAIKEREANKEADRKLQFAEMAKEALDSGAHGRLQQAVTGIKNNFRTPDDWERDQSSGITTKDLPFLPTSGAMQY